MMDDQDREKEVQMPMEPSERRASGDMSRTQQTLILGAILIIFGLFGFNYMQSHDASDPDAICHSIFSSQSYKDCRVDHAAARMRALDPYN